MSSESPAPSKGSKRQALKRRLERFKQAIQPSFQLFPRSGSTAALSTGARSSSPAPSGTSVKSATTTPAFLPKSGAPGSSTSTPGASPALTTVNTTATSPGPATTAKLREAGDVAFSGLEAALRVLEKSADVFPPLKSAIGGFIACLDIVQTASANDKDYEELTSEFTKMLGTLNQYLGELGSEDPNGSAARIALSIEAEVRHIGKQLGRGKGRRMIESAQDQEDVIKRYRRIEGLFRQLQSDMILRVLRNTNKHHMTTLLRGMSPVDDARYNSSYSTTVKRRGCTKETREKVQAELQDWVRDPNAAQVYWMNGMGGTGKTTIAYSLCEWLEANQRLGASFFCSRVSSSCRNVNGIVATIAYQLALYSPVFQSALCNLLEDEPDACRLNVVQQFEKLVRKPLLSRKDEIPEGVVVVIDALDECDDDYGVRLILETLLRLGSDLPLKFFVTSRPEPTIRDNMLSQGRYSPAVLHLHDIEQSIVEGDIKKYLTEALGSMPIPPTDEQIEQLAKRAGKLFIYAATVVRYILSGRGSTNSISRLKAMLATDTHSTGQDSTKKYKGLDELYTTILSIALNAEELEEKEVEAMRLVLRTVVCAKEPMTTSTMAALLDLSEEQVSSALQPLLSVLHVSQSGGLVSTLHASFPDYMLDDFRSRDFRCDLARHSDLLANRCFDVMEKQLRFNICGLESSFVFDKDVPDLDQRIKACISPTLFYACRYWGEHLRLSGASDKLCDKLSRFLTDKLLFWMEVLNLNRCIAPGVSILFQAEAWLSAARVSTDVHKHAVDSRDFVTRFAAGACNRATPHIYLSALPSCARSNFVYANYWGRTRGLIDIKGTAIGRRSKASQVTWSTAGYVYSVAFSPDGSRIVAGCDESSIRLMHAHTGETIAGAFEGHTHGITSVAFSPDSIHIVSGSKDLSIRVWDTRTGDTVIGPLEGHTKCVKSVAFSPDGTRIVSGSDDQSIWLWDAQTGDNIAGPLGGHTDSIHSLSFSPDSTRVVSGSADLTLRVWDARTGDPIQGPFEGHTGVVKSVTFSPNGTHIFSGSDDRTILVWDSHTVDTIAGPFKGHTGSVNSVASSPDGTRVASGSDDRTIRVWDTLSGGCIAGPFEGHTYAVESVAFSPDGSHIVSGSGDFTIRVWDIHTNNTIAEPFAGHTGGITSVTFSPDCTNIVSGSDDNTIQVWDARAGNSIMGPLEGHTGSVLSIVFSPDGTRFVSGSSDNTIRVWDARTGNAIAGPLKGHRDSVNSVAFSPDGNRIVTGSSDRTIRVWNARAWNTIGGPFEGHTYSVLSVRFSPDGTRIVSGSDDRTIRVWDARTGETIIGPLEGHSRWVKSVAFSPDGARIISGSAYSLGIVPLAPSSDAIDEPLEGHTGTVNSAVFPEVPDDTKDQTIRVWDAHTGGAIVGLFEGHTSGVNCITFSPNGTRIAAGSDDYEGTIQVWDSHTGDNIAGPFNGHTQGVQCVAFSPDGAYIVSGSGDLTIRVWDVHARNNTTGSVEGHTDLARSTVFSPDHQDISSPVVSTHISNSTRHDHIHNDLVSIQDFESGNDGWFTKGNLPLFWVSPDFRDHVPHPRNTLLIGHQGTAFIDYRNLALGERWSDCYIPQ